MSEESAAAVRAWLFWKFIEACTEAGLDWRDEVAQFGKAGR